MWSTFVLQGLSLAAFIAWNAFVLLPSLLKDVLLVALYYNRGGKRGGQRHDDDEEEDEGEESSSVVFYEGLVEHVRSKPVKNAFKYKVRVCMVNLDEPPGWWRTKQDAGDKSLSSAKVREICKTEGPVWLLTVPSCCGYAQNPISVYYAFDKDGVELEQCVAEVTNTPWGERVVFSFEPEMKDALPKSLHVSPFMDMKNTWKIRTQAPSPTKGLKVDIFVGHPEYGSYFLARLTCRVSKHRGTRSERADLRTLYDYGYMPQRVALWIYWQAMVLVWKGAPMFMHPRLEDYREAVEREMDRKQVGQKYRSWDFLRVQWPFNRD